MSVTKAAYSLAIVFAGSMAILQTCGWLYYQIRPTGRTSSVDKLYIAELKQTISKLSHDNATLKRKLIAMNSRSSNKPATQKADKNEQHTPNSADKSQLLAMFVPPTSKE